MTQSAVLYSSEEEKLHSLCHYINCVCYFCFVEFGLPSSSWKLAVKTNVVLVSNFQSDSG